MGASFERTLPARTDALPALIDSIERWLDDAGVPPADAARLMIAFDEMVSNIARHGAATLSVSAAVEGGRLQAMLVDDGPPFDPLGAEVPDTDLGIDERAIGGLGIHLVREMMDDIAYDHENGRNRLRFSKTLS